MNALMMLHVQGFSMRDIQLIVDELSQFILFYLTLSYPSVVPCIRFQ